MKAIAAVLLILLCSQAVQPTAGFFRWLKSHLYYQDTLVNSVSTELTENLCLDPNAQADCTEHRNNAKVDLADKLAKRRDSYCRASAKSHAPIDVFRCLGFKLMAASAYYVDCVEANHKQREPCASFQKTFDAILENNRQVYNETTCEARKLKTDDCLSLWDAKMEYILKEQESLASITNTYCEPSTQPAKASGECLKGLIAAAFADVIFATAQYESVCIGQSEASCATQQLNLEYTKKYYEELLSYEHK